MSKKCDHPRRYRRQVRASSQTITKDRHSVERVEKCDMCGMWRYIHEVNGTRMEGRWTDKAMPGRG